jgi:hypothetical protein
MKKILLGAIAACVLTLASCATTFPLTATGNNLGSKMGTASVTYLFGTIPLGGDAGIYAAAKNGGLTKISTVDVKVSPMLFVTTYTTLVSGE